ncbi:helix-turn-helix domain-containing protein [Aurantimonas sp. HBX-1]|uniref:winged helix-turn-helix transcriptional regulator n=1 Tax=Aurantimonas sp. HBX-1 TaxID=2906072 RepID=UPI001F251A3F|nr:winged helix-turn-helix transcriptional regulator [Aurantimonas sp. HBX-1]UIJ71616.1 winged helix-turn-helix transcriptional regulator [Aurantimonas sp. HBX-1]
MKLEKITELPDTRRRRHYDDSCAAAHALDLVGERWALLVMRELYWGPKRFSALRASLPGISANVLTQRLEGLEAAGIVIRRRLPPPSGAQVYELTEWGQESEPIFQALGRWAARSPRHDPTLPFSAASLLLSLRTMLDPGRADGLAARIGFVLGVETYVADLGAGRIEIAPGPTEGADVVFAGAPTVIAAAIYGGQDLAALEAEGALRITGDRALAARFVALFPLPAKAAPPG